MTLRLVLADDHTLVLEGLRALLDAEVGLEVVDTCTDASEALQAVAEHRPDVLILDQNMPGLKGLDTARQLRTEGSSVPILILTATINDEVLMGAVKLEGVGIVLKESAGHDLVQAIRRIHLGEPSIPKGLLERALRLSISGNDSGHLWPELTERQREVVLALTSGMSNKRIAASLSITEGTVKQYLHGIFRKLGVSSRVQLLVLAGRRSER